MSGFAMASKLAPAVSQLPANGFFADHIFELIKLIFEAGSYQSPMEEERQHFYVLYRRIIGDHLLQQA